MKCHSRETSHTKGYGANPECGEKRSSIFGISRGNVALALEMAAKVDYLLFGRDYFSI
jgi:hypothetical protein